MFNSNSCVICNDSISDPVCSSCYIKQTQTLLEDLKVNFRINNFIKDKLKNELHLENINDAECILCKKDNVSICRYCFSIILIRILRELNFPEDLIENFKYSPMYDEEFIQNKNILNIEMEV